MIGFKQTKPIKLITRTPPEDLVYCDVCGGINAMASTAVKIDCTACGTTGYQNLWSSIDAAASYRPGAIKRWNQVAGAVDYIGECSIKLDIRYKDFLPQIEWIEMGGTKYAFTFLRDPGEAFGQPRMVLALSRK
jgi:hypothetical protein